jgi:ferric-dicitrate binding protein FerR (iron transport regulator)
MRREARELRIRGVFKAGDTGVFVDAMESYFSLTAQRRGDALERYRTENTGQRRDE